MKNKKIKIDYQSVINHYAKERIELIELLNSYAQIAINNKNIEEPILRFSEMEFDEIEYVLSSIYGIDVCWECFLHHCTQQEVEEGLNEHSEVTIPFGETENALCLLKISDMQFLKDVDAVLAKRAEFMSNWISQYACLVCTFDTDNIQRYMHSIAKMRKVLRGSQFKIIEVECPSEQVNSSFVILSNQSTGVDFFELEELFILLGIEDNFEPVLSQSCFRLIMERLSPNIPLFDCEEYSLSVWHKDCFEND